MENLNKELQFEIMRRLEDSADMIRCRLISKTFNELYPNLRSINLECSLGMYLESRSWVSLDPNAPQPIIPIFKSIFMKLLDSLKVVESVSINTHSMLKYMPDANVFDPSDDLWLTEYDFLSEWLSKFRKNLKSLTVFDFYLQSYHRQSYFMQMVALFCDKLEELHVAYAWLSMDNLNSIKTLTKLTLEFIKMEDKDLNMLNEYFPNLEVLHLHTNTTAFKQPKIHILKLKKCHWTLLCAEVVSITFITPNLDKLELECEKPVAVNIRAPILSDCQLNLDDESTISVALRFLNLKTLQLNSLYLLSGFPVIATVENLTVDSTRKEGTDVGDTQLTLGELFTVFPNLKSLILKPNAWAELQARHNPLGWQDWDGKEGFETFCAYLLLADSDSTFTTVAIILNQCIGLTEVSFLIHGDVARRIARRFRSKCKARWPGIKWKWGSWKHGLKDSWTKSTGI